MYRLGVISTGTLSHDLNRWWYRVRGLEDPYQKIAEDNVREKQSESGYVWALKDVGFDVKQGEAIGIIGKNGAGKSTLLKILSRVTSLTKGEIKINGRIASLLEVGTGFHPELTGRENIFLNGAILGMKKHEIRSKLDEIIDFSGVERYVDTPVKRYSSGMTVRLAFAVAAHLEPEILVVDEVLAVGDAEFQKKALGKMKEVSQSGGRTVLFVSHNMASVKSLCDKGIVLVNGAVQFSGTSTDAVSFYLKGNSETMHKKTFGSLFQNDLFTLHEISLNPRNQSSDFALDESHEIELNTKITFHRNTSTYHLTYVLNNENGEALFAFSHKGNGLHLKESLNNLKCTFPENFLNLGTYYLSLYIIKDSRTTVFVEKDIISFDVQANKRSLGSWMGKEPGFIKPVFNWKFVN